MKPLFTTFTTGIAALLLDQLHKWVMLERLYAEHAPPIVVTDFFSLVMVWNKGVSFGMFNRPGGLALSPYVLILVSLGIAAALVRLAMKSTHALERAGYGLVIGGALGNVIDRLRFGAVADFFYVHVGDLGWPAFNIADSAICVGVFLLLIAMLRGSKIAP